MRFPLERLSSFILSSIDEVRSELTVPAAGLRRCAGRGRFGLPWLHNSGRDWRWKVAPYLLYRQTNGRVPVFLVKAAIPGVKATLGTLQLNVV